MTELGNQVTRQGQQDIRMELHRVRFGPDELALVAAVGRELDAGKTPSARNGGVILPGTPSPPSGSPGKEYVYDRSKPRRSESGSWKGPAGRQGASRGHAEADSAPPDLESTPEATDLESLEALRRAYPGVEVWDESDAVWILTPAKLLPGPRPRVYFITVFPKNPQISRRPGRFEPPMPRAWGFWADGSWIGPRHTNPPDGSICAFEQEDLTWLPGESLVDLMDLYSLWALGQIHLEFFGRWPGHQRNHSLYEQIIECHPSEHCGCKTPKGTYAECCRDDDLRNLRLEDAISFNLPGRSPPTEVVRFLQERRDPPPVTARMKAPPSQANQ